MHVKQQIDQKQNHKNKKKIMTDETCLDIEWHIGGAQNTKVVKITPKAKKCQ